MHSNLKIVKLLALVAMTALTAAAQAGPVVLKSPNGALEISIATLRGQSVQPEGGQLAYRVTFRGQPVLEWSHLGFLTAGCRSRWPVCQWPSTPPPRPTTTS